MRIETKAVHAGDRKKDRLRQIPVTTPIVLAASYIAEETAELDQLLGREIPGFSYARYSNPTNEALEEQVTALESGAGTLACCSGMTALHMALLSALTDRPKSVVAASALYGASISLLTKILAPLGVEVTFVDITDLAAVRQAVEREKPGAILLESVSNPLLRVGAIDHIAALAREHGTALIVDNTFATPVMVRPLELGAHYTVHSATKYMSGHGDVLGGTVTAGQEEMDVLRAVSRSAGGQLGPFESYLVMRGIKTLPLRFERQCANACRLANWLASHPKIERVYYPGNPAHPDADNIRRLFAPGLHGAMLSFDLRGADKLAMMTFMDRLQLIVKGTSLGDVHTMALYPVIASHRDLAPKQRERMGIRESLLRISVGIEAVEDVIADLEQALGA